MALTQPQIDLLYSQLTQAKSTSVDGTSVTNQSSESLLKVLQFCATQSAAAGKTRPFRLQYFRSPGMIYGIR